MEFYRAEYLLHFFKEYTEKEKKQYDKENAGGFEKNDLMRQAMSNQSSLMNNLQKNLNMNTSLPKLHNLPTKFPF